MLSFIACGRRQQTAVETKLMVSTFKLERWLSMFFAAIHLVLSVLWRWRWRLPTQSS
jgi:hypothetical protein